MDFGAREFGGPPVWSTDERYLALPEWTDGSTTWANWRTQRLTVFDLRGRLEATAAREFTLPRLQSVDADAVVAVADTDAAPVSIRLAHLAWAALGSRRVALRPRARVPGLWPAAAAGWYGGGLGLLLLALPVAALWRAVRRLLRRGQR